jgi:hypothetical protein
MTTNSTLEQSPVRTRKPRPSVASRRAGYLIGVALNVVLLYLINEAPGWDAVPFLTDETAQVIGLVNASIVISIVVYAIYVAYDPRWLRALGDMVTAIVAFVVMVAVWRVFPFDFTAYSFDWAALMRVLLAVGMFGAIVGAVSNLVSFVQYCSDSLGTSCGSNPKT